MENAKRSPRGPRPQGRRLWIFRGAALLSPLLLLLVLELVLRGVGHGHDTAFLRRVEVDGRAHLRDNPDFYTLFFPEHLLPRQLPFTVPAEKPDGEVRIALLGGSAAMGIPEPAYGMGPILEEQLQFRHPDVEIEVLDLANTAINSHVVRRIASSLAPLRPDAVVVYLGNNEVVGPFGAGTVFTPVAPSSAWIRTSLALRASRVGQLLQGIVGGTSGRDGPEGWRGMEMFVEQSVRHDAPGLERVREHFEANLEAIAAVCEDLGVPMVLSTVGVNLRHCGPFASVEDPGADEQARRRFDRAMDAGDRLWERGAADSARVLYDEALALDPTHADLHYRLGRLLFAAGEEEAAVEHLRDAREYDTLRFRADAAINGVIRRLAPRHEHVLLAEVEAALASVSPAGLPGRELFLEHVHLDFAGNQLAARVIADVLEPALADRIGPAAGEEWLDTNAVARRLAYTAYGRQEVLSQTLRMIQRPPFTGQSDHVEQLDHLARQLQALEPASDPAVLEGMWPMIEASIEAEPDEWIRRFRAAAFLAEGLGDPVRAEPLWRGIVEEQPHFAAAVNGWARAVAAQGRLPQATRLFERSLQLDPHQVEARRGLASCLRRLGPNDPDRRWRALELEERALRLEGTPQALRRLRETLQGEARWWGERGEEARARTLRTRAAALPVPEPRTTDAPAPLGEAGGSTPVVPDSPGDSD